MRAPAFQLPPLLLPPLLIAAGVLSSCASPPRVLSPDGRPQAYYQTAFPAHDTSGELGEAMRAVKQISYTAEYLTHVFTYEEGLTEADILAGDVSARAAGSFPETQSKAGTATIIGRSIDRITLLTTHHVVYLPPVLVQFYEEEEGRAGTAPSRPPRVASVSYRTSEMGGLLQHPDLGPFEVLARDEENDLAILGMRLRQWSVPTDYPPLRLNIGDPRRLSWGSFVYVLGFPRGYPMVTRAIVSDPDRDGRGAFFTDGLWNEGISGGMILGVRGETGELEPVGLARAGAADRELRLLPDTTGIPIHDDVVRPYTGPLYLESFLRIQYGITLSVPMTVVNEFLARSRGGVRSRGYPIP
jgi:hypothetical protein